VIGRDVGVDGDIDRLVRWGLTLSLSVAVNVAVPVKPLWTRTVYVTVPVLWPPLTFTDATPVPGVADQL
jgi:hypothetical protein